MSAPLHWEARARRLCRATPRRGARRGRATHLCALAVVGIKGQVAISQRSKRKDGWPDALRQAPHVQNVLPAVCAAKGAYVRCCGAGHSRRGGHPTRGAAAQLAASQGEPQCERSQAGGQKRGRSPRLLCMKAGRGGRWSGGVPAQRPSHASATYEACRSSRARASMQHGRGLAAAQYFAHPPARPPVCSARIHPAHEGHPARLMCASRAASHPVPSRGGRQAGLTISA